MSQSLRRAIWQRMCFLQEAGVESLPKKTARTILEEPDLEEPKGVPHLPIPQEANVPRAKSPDSKLQPDVPQISRSRSATPSTAVDLPALAKEVAACTKCKELATTRTQTVFGVGNPNADLCFFGEAPGANEDKQGVPFVGRAGVLLTDIIEKGMKLRREDVYILNVLKCRPPSNRNPLPEEELNCQPFLQRQFELIQPKFICCLGKFAAQSMLQSKLAIGKLRGKVHDVEGWQVVCTYHPAYLLRNPAAKAHVWEDIKLLMAAMEHPSSK